MSATPQLYTCMHMRLRIMILFLRSRRSLRRLWLIGAVESDPGAFRSQLRFLVRAASAETQFLTTEIDLSRSSHLR